MSDHMRHLGRLALAFPVPPIDPRTLMVYADALKEHPGDLLAWAVDAEIASSQHFPRVANLLERIRQRKIQFADEQRIADQKRLLAEPRNEAPPKLMELLNKERERGGPPRKLFG